MLLKELRSKSGDYNLFDFIDYFNDIPNTKPYYTEFILKYGNKTLVMSNGKILTVLEGESRKNMSIQDILDLYSKNADSAAWIQLIFLSVPSAMRNFRLTVCASNGDLLICESMMTSFFINTLPGVHFSQTKTGGVLRNPLAVR